MNARAYLAYVKGTRPTGRCMAAALGIEGGIKPPIGGLDVLVRWGSQKAMPYSRITVNEARALSMASDKIRSLEAFQNAGIRTPAWSQDFNVLAQYGQYILGRSRSGMKGKDIVVYDPTGRSGDKYPQSPTKFHDFYSLYVKPTSEVRIHVVNDHVIRVQRKYLDFPEKAQKNPFICNYEHGYRFRAPRLELHNRRKQAAIGAVKALGLDFGAVDIIIGGDNYEYVLEVNTAPACSPLTARCYSSAIALLVQQRSGESIRLAPQVLEAEVVPEEGEDW